MKSITRLEVEEKDKELSQPALIWAGLGTDLDLFPTITLLRGRQREGKQASPIQAFVNALSNAEDRIWILDSYFGKKPARIENIVRYIERAEARSIRIISKFSDKEILKRLQHRRRVDSRKRFLPPDFGISWQKLYSFPDLHDRFAIVDNELWHFGGSIGGNQEILTAASRGWSAFSNGAIDQYLEIWSHLERIRQ